MMMTTPTKDGVDVSRLNSSDIVSGTVSEKSKFKINNVNNN